MSTRTAIAATTTAASAAGAKGTAGMGHASASGIDSEALVWHINLACIVLLALFVVIRLPQTIALFSHKEWIGSHFLRHVAHRPLIRRSVSSEIYSAYKEDNSWKEDQEEQEKFDSSTQLHNVYLHPSHERNGASSEKQRKVAVATASVIPAFINRAPTHIPATYFAKLRPILHPLRLRILPGFAVSQAIFLVLYSFAMLYATFYKSNIFNDTKRTGWIAAAQLPIVFAMAQKNSVIGGLLGYGYEKLNYLHRFAGRVVVVTTNIHTFHFVYKWVLAGTFSTSIKRPAAMWGLVATCCINLIYFFSTAYWRQRAYNVFLVSHIVGFSLLLPALYMHKPTTLPYIVASLVFFGADHIMRLMKTRLTTAHIHPIPELDLTRIEVRSINAGWRAGQHVRLRILSQGMGPIGWAESHPFTIASVARSEEGLVLICKRAGGWTRRIYDMAKQSKGRGPATDHGAGREVTVMVEGPYGGPQRTVIESFSSAVFVAAGSGITFALAAIQDLVQKDLAGESRIKVIELLWIVREPSHLTPLLPKFNDLIESSAFTPVRISVFYTRAPTGKQPPFYAALTDAPFINAPSPSISPAHHQHFPPGLTLSPGRPRIATFIEFAIQRAVAQRNASPAKSELTGLVIGVCGPSGLADDVAKAAAMVDSTQRDKVGGIEICEEVFGW